MGVAQYAPEIWLKDASAPLAVNHAYEANNATDETPVQGVLLRVLGLAFLTQWRVWSTNGTK